MARALISHLVTDYAKWRPVFDAKTPKLEDVGITIIAVLRNADNPNSVWVFLEGDRVVGEAFLQDPEIERIMQRGGGPYRNRLDRVRNANFVAPCRYTKDPTGADEFCSLRSQVPCLR